MGHGRLRRAVSYKAPLTNCRPTNRNPWTEEKTVDKISPAKDRSVSAQRFHRHDPFCYLRLRMDTWLPQIIDVNEAHLCSVSPSINRKHPFLTGLAIAAWFVIDLFFTAVVTSFCLVHNLCRTTPTVKMHFHCNCVTFGLATWAWFQCTTS